MREYGMGSHGGPWEPGSIDDGISSGHQPAQTYGKAEIVPDKSAIRPGILKPRSVTNLSKPKVANTEVCNQAQSY